MIKFKIMKKTYTNYRLSMVLLFFVALLNLQACKDATETTSIPRVLEVNPVEGAVGTFVSISGEFFSATKDNNKVTFGSVEAKIIDANKTTITVFVPAGATTGTVNVSVNSYVSKSDVTFKVTTGLPKPYILSIDPSTGSSADGTEVKISGYNFSINKADYIVKFGVEYMKDKNGKDMIDPKSGVLATVTSASAGLIVTSVPKGTRNGNVIVFIASDTLDIGFNFKVPGPTLESVIAKSGIAGATVQINGSAFSKTPSNNIVKFNEVLATVLSSTKDMLVAQVPESTTGKISISVDGQSDTLKNEFTFPHTITGFNPPSGKATVGTDKNEVPGDAVTISGTNFSSSSEMNEVYFGDVKATNIESSTHGSIKVIVPLGAKTGKISVVINGLKKVSAADFIVNN